MRSLSQYATGERVTQGREPDARSKGAAMIEKSVMDLPGLLRDELPRDGPRGDTHLSHACLRMNYEPSEEFFI